MRGPPGRDAVQIHRVVHQVVVLAGFVNRLCPLLKWRNLACVGDVFEQSVRSESHTGPFFNQCGRTGIAPISGLAHRRPQHRKPVGPSWRRAVVRTRFGHVGGIELKHCHPRSDIHNRQSPSLQAAVPRANPLDRQFGADTNRFSGPPTHFQQRGAFQFDCPVDFVRALGNVDEQMDVGIQPVHLGNQPRKRHRLIRIEFGRNRVVCNGGNRRHKKGQAYNEQTAEETVLHQKSSCVSSIRELSQTPIIKVNNLFCTSCRPAISGFSPKPDPTASPRSPDPGQIRAEPRVAALGGGEDARR